MFNTKLNYAHIDVKLAKCLNSLLYFIQRRLH